MTPDVQALRRENEVLRERVAYLEDALGANIEMPVWLGLTRSEARVLAVLLARDIAVTDAIMAALYRDRGRDEPDPRIVSAFIFKLRRKLTPLGLRIETVWGGGHRLTPEMKAKARQLISDREVCTIGQSGVAA